MPAASIRILAGLTSRCTRPRLWAWWSASATEATNSADSRNEGRAWLGPVRQVAPLDVLRHHEAEAVRSASGVVDRNDMGMVERGDDARLAQELLDVFRAVDSLGLGDLDRHRPGELIVAGQVDPAKCAFTETALHAIAADRGGNRGTADGALVARCRRQSERPVSSVSEIACTFSTARMHRRSSPVSSGQSRQSSSTDGSRPWSLSSCQRTSRF